MISLSAGRKPLTTRGSARYGRCSTVYALDLAGLLDVAAHEGIEARMLALRSSRCRSCGCRAMAERLLLHVVGAMRSAASSSDAGADAAGTRVASRAAACDKRRSRDGGRHRRQQRRPGPRSAPPPSAGPATPAAAPSIICCWISCCTSDAGCASANHAIGHGHRAACDRHRSGDRGHRGRSDGAAAAGTRPRGKTRSRCAPASKLR